ncbi:thioredoxin family protein [candidate division KSB1 bacterium]|nr:thioredoxin family protein [candidate division KSB1 bacterium]
MQKLFIIILMFGLFLWFGCGNNEAQTKTDTVEAKLQTLPKAITQVKNTPQITFVELGSVNCIPCKMMQPVMQAIETEFGDQVKIVFHDVWKDPAPGQKYGIRIIPTQVFLDAAGKEFFRHEGFFPKEEIEKLLLTKGLVKKIPTEKKKN